MGGDAQLSFDGLLSHLEGASSILAKKKPKKKKPSVCTEQHWGGRAQNYPVGIPCKQIDGAFHTELHTKSKLFNLKQRLDIDRF